MIYEFEARIRYSQTGTDGLLTLPALVDFFQDAAIENATELQKAAPTEEMSKLVWFLAAWQIDVFRYPTCGESVVVGTFPYRFGGGTGLRNLYMRTKDGEMLAYGDSTWALMNRESGTMVRVPQWLSELYPLGEKLPMNYRGRHIELPKERKELEHVRVGRWHLDSNLHMNNGQYVRLAMQVLPEASYKSLRVEYKKSAVEGDALSLCHGTVDGREVVVLGADDGIYAVAEFSVTGEKK